MSLLSSFILTLLVITVSCHMTVFRDGVWQVVPGRNRFGSFGPMNDLWRSGFRNPGQFQTAWNSDDIWWNSDAPEFPQSPQGSLNNPTQWFSNDDGNQQTDLTDPWAQYRLLQESVNPGTSLNSTINDNAAIQTPDVTAPWNTFGAQLGNRAIVPNAGNQFPMIPNNNVIIDPVRPFQTGSNMVGFPWNNQFQGPTNNGLPFNGNNNGMPFNGNTNGMPFNGNNNGMPFNGNSNGMPFNGNNNGLPFNGNNNGLPFNGNTNGLPFNGNNNGMPFNGNTNGMPFNGNNNGMPFNGNSNGMPFNGNNNGVPFNGNNNGLPFNGNNNGLPFNGINTDMPVTGSNNGVQGFQNNGMPFNDNNNGIPFSGNNNGIPFNGVDNGMPFISNNNGMQGFPNNGLPFNDNRNMGKKK